MRAINHYLFFAGENDPILSPYKRHDWGPPVRKDGSPRRHYHRYGKLSRALAAYGTDLVRSRPKTVTTIGFLLDDFMTEVNNAFTKPLSDTLTHQRDVILFDFLARGLALTHRPFDALELSCATLDTVQTPLLWIMMERQCDAPVQEKLAEYVRKGGKLIIAGRLCEETFDHTPCTILRDAIGVQHLHSDPPFTPANIQAFDHTDVPVSFLETYSGDFDEVFATSAEGQPVGFVKQVGKGQLMMFGAALPAGTLEDLDVLHQMANRMKCPPLFTMSDWVDVRLSEGENGEFLFVNNYQDDPIETIISSGGVPLLGGHAPSLPARRGAILPLNWHVKSGIMIHYLTSEVIQVSDDGERLVLKTDQAECHAEVSLDGYHCDDSLIEQRISNQRLKLHTKNSIIELVKVKTL
jgi:beta-galactosidase